MARRIYGGLKMNKNTKETVIELAAIGHSNMLRGLYLSAMGDENDETEVLTRSFLLIQTVANSMFIDDLNRAEPMLIASTEYFRRIADDIRNLHFKISDIINFTTDLLFIENMNNLDIKYMFFNRMKEDIKDKYINLFGENSETIDNLARELAEKVYKNKSKKAMFNIALKRCQPYIEKVNSILDEDSKINIYGFEV